MDVERLAAKVRAINRVNELLLPVYDKLAPVFQPRVGKLVVKEDGSLLAKYQKLVPEFRYPETKVYRTRSKFSLTWTINVGENYGGSNWLYHDLGVYVGDIREGILTTLAPRPDTQPTYNVETVLQLIEKRNAAKKAYDEADEALFPFCDF